MMHSQQNLYDELRIALIAIDKQIEVATAQLEDKRVRGNFPESETIYVFQDKNGGYIMAPLIISRAQILGSMAALRTAQDAIRKPGPRR